MIHVHRSNRAERLVDALAERVAHDPPPPTESIVVVVPSRGMERWLARELATRLGVWANPSFPFPRHFLEKTLDAVLGPPPEGALPFDPPVLGWAVAALLRELAPTSGFEEIAAYLDRPDRAKRTIEVGFALADRFDQYAVYRPEVVLGWEAGSDDHAQARLFRALVERHRPAHVARRANDTFAKLASLAPITGLPSRIHVFGIAALPPLYVRLFAALASRVETRLYLLDPSVEHWSQTDSPAKADRLRREAAEHGVDPSLLHLDEGHPLLGALGALGRDFHALLAESCEGFASDDARFDDPGRATALATIQSNILHLRSEKPAVELHDDDDSIEVHACHTKMRELEVLYDRILAAFAADPTLRAEDVVVMAPDIDAYAPLIDAVFDIAPAGRPTVKYTIADRSAPSTSPIVDAFFSVLDVVESRFEASRVIEALSIEPIRRRFGLDAGDFESLRRLTHEAGVRWAADEEHRRDVGLPAERANSWAFGIDRLLLGAVSASDATFEGVLPYQDVEGGAAIPVGGLARFLRILASRRRAFAEPHPIPWWRDALGDLLELTCDAGPRYAQEHARVVATLDDLVDDAARAGFTDSVDLAIVRRAVANALERSSPAHGFLSHGVTFCRLVPMRSIPFRVVGLLGMDDESFPRRDRALDFDLLATCRRRGDRSVRDEDRYLFLEALLSARDRLIVTYVGRGVHDDRVRPRSVVLDQLLATCATTFTIAGEKDPAKAVIDRLVTTQPLQPFDPRAFGMSRDDARHRTFAASYVESAAAVRVTPTESTVGLAASIVEIGIPDGEPITRVTLEDLTLSIREPLRFFAERRLGLALRKKDLAVEDREPLEPDALDGWKVGDELLRSSMDENAIARIRGRLRAAGVLPFGAIGERYFAEQLEEAQPIRDELAAFGTGPTSVLQASVEVDGVTIEGAIPDFRQRGFARGSFSKSGSKLLGAWVDHLVSSIVSPGIESSTLVVRGENDNDVETWRFLSVDDPKRVLVDLVHVHRDARRFPLPLVRETGKALLKELFSSGKNRTFEEGVEKARVALIGELAPKSWSNPFPDDYLAVFYPTEESLRAVPAPRDFDSVVRRVFAPLVAALERVS